MEPSRPSHGLWSGLILLVFRLACGIHPTSDQFAIDASLLKYFEGEEAVLFLEGFPRDATEVSWYRDTKASEPNLILRHLPPSNTWREGPRFSGRENITEGSLLFSRVEIRDTGDYTVKVISPNRVQTATALLRIGERFTTPVLTVNTSLAVELDAVRASCNTNATKIEWHLSDRLVVSNDRMTLSPDNQTLVIHRVSRSDTWFECVASNSADMTKNVFAMLSVAYGPDPLSLRSEPYNYEGVLEADIGSLVNMECRSYSLPAPTYRWTHYNTGLNVSEQKITIQNLTEKQLGRYRCTVQNSRTQITIYEDVWINKPRYRPDPDVLHLAKPMVVVLIMLAVLGGLSFCAMLIFILMGQCSNSDGSHRVEAHRGSDPSSFFQSARYTYSCYGFSTPSRCSACRGRMGPHKYLPQSYKYKTHNTEGEVTDRDKLKVTYETCLPEPSPESS